MSVLYTFFNIFFFFFFGLFTKLKTVGAPPPVGTLVHTYLHNARWGYMSA